MSEVTAKIQLRHGTAAQWTAANPVLLQTELGWETDTDKFKRGDGVTAWNSLAYKYYTIAQVDGFLSGKSDTGHTHVISDVTGLQTALDGKQPLDSDLSAIAALSPPNDDIIQRKLGVWVNRTMAQIKVDLALTKSDVGLGNVDNTSDVNKPISSATQSALDLKADLVGGLVPSAQLPSFVDDVIEAADFASLPATGSTGKIYVTLDDGKTYRWSGSAYVEISASLALGETSSTAYRGDRGKIAYDHSQLTSGNPHNVTKSDVGLGNADNTSDANKPVSTAQQAALDLKVDENAAITGATKTKITYDAKGLVTAGADATTADINDSTNRRYVTDADLVDIGNLSGINTGDQDLSALAPKASPTFTGTVVLPAVTLGGIATFSEDAELRLDPALSADGKFCGITEVVTAGETIAFGELVYLKAADSQWYLADADADATSGAVKLAIAVTSGTDNNPMTVLHYGKIRADAKFPALTVGAPAYVSTTPGAVQVAQPSGTDDVIRIAGHALTADELFFNPSNDYITHI